MELSLSTAIHRTDCNLAGQEAGAYAFVGTANSVRTLPTLSGTAGATNTYNSVIYELANCSTTPWVTLTI